MMKRKKIFRFLAIGVCGAVLAGCSTNEDSTTDTSATESEETQSVDTTSSKSSSSASEASSNATSGKTDGSEEASNSSTDQESEATSSQESVDVSSELKMHSDTVLLPTDFPTDDLSSVSADITTNEENHYTVNYTDEQGDLVEVSGTVYKNPDESEKEITDFMNGKNQGPVSDNKDDGKDLGYGITGYMLAGLGSTYFSWEEGNWLFSITSVAEDKMVNVGIAKKIVDYLEDHYLPAPNDQGVVYLHYPQGGKEVDVDIRWQDSNMIYQLKTTRVPLDALEITVSMK